MSDGQLVLFKSLKYKNDPKIKKKIAKKKKEWEVAFFFFRIKWLVSIEKVIENYQIFGQRSNSTNNAKF